MSTWYKINLLPLAPYFFGKEIMAELGNRQSYFQRSAVFPQQSSLLGLLRHQILLQHGLAKPAVDNTGNAAKLVGNEGFNPAQKMESQDESGNATKGYGNIIRLSPVFLQRNNSGHYFVDDRQLTFDERGDIFETVPGESASVSSLSGQTKAIMLKSRNGAGSFDFTAKTPYREMLTDFAAADSVELDTVIRTSDQVGVYNYQKRPGETKESNAAYFKRVYENLGVRTALPSTKSGELFYIKSMNSANHLNPVWSFGFYVEMADDSTLQTSSGRMAIMGKEQSAFMISIEDATTNAAVMDNNTNEANGLVKIILLSDAFVHEAELLKHSLLINGVTVRFRSFTKPLDRHLFNHSNLRHKDKSECYHLLKRGTVIFTENAHAVANHLEEQSNWRTIGNNYFIIKPTSAHA
jgi:CRISPR-associated protein Cmr3